MLLDDNRTTLAKASRQPDVCPLYLVTNRAKIHADKRKREALHAADYQEPKSDILLPLEARMSASHFRRVFF